MYWATRYQPYGILHFPSALSLTFVSIVATGLLLVMVLLMAEGLLMSMSLGVQEGETKGSCHRPHDNHRGYTGRSLHLRGRDRKHLDRENDR